MYYENFYEIIKKKMESGLCANIVYKGDSVSLKDFMSYVDGTVPCQVDTLNNKN